MFLNFMEGWSSRDKKDGTVPSVCACAGSASEPPLNGCYIIEEPLF